MDFYSLFVYSTTILSALIDFSTSFVYSTTVLSVLIDFSASFVYSTTVSSALIDFSTSFGDKCQVLIQLITTPNFQTTPTQQKASPSAKGEVISTDNLKYLSYRRNQVLYMLLFRIVHLQCVAIDCT